MKEAKEIVYQYDGDQNDRESEMDMDGDIPVPAAGNTIMRRSKRWKVVQVNKHQEMAPGAIPAYLVFLTSSLT